MTKRKGPDGPRVEQIDNGIGELLLKNMDSLSISTWTDEDIEQLIGLLCAEMARRMINVLEQPSNER